MQETTQRGGVAFAVDEVRPAEIPLPECRAHEAVRKMLGSDVESCSDYSGKVIRDVNYQPLLAAVYTAFNRHQPLILSPDAVWITITQGVAHHMAIHGERLRSRFVAHQGRLRLTFEFDDWVEGSPENPWAEAFAFWAGQIRDHVGQPVHDALVCDFSTTGPVERAVSHIVMMDVFERYFHYDLYGICGIPSITLEGTPADWRRLADKAAGLRVFDLDWWLSHLLPICRQFVEASRGNVDLAHWQSICKLREEYGGDIINGWVAKLFPYLRAFVHGPCTHRNPVFESGEGFTTMVAPPGLSRVPVTWRHKVTGHERQMEAIGGLLGVAQDPKTLALQPKAGWAVREAEKLDVLLARLAAEHTTFPGLRQEDLKDVSYLPPDLARFNYSIGGGALFLPKLPPDLTKFYYSTDGAELFAHQPRAACRIVAASELERLDWGKVSKSLRNNDCPNGHIWYRLARLGDGTALAINPDPAYGSPGRKRFERDSGWDQRRSFVAICHCRRKTQGRPGKNPVVAVSFTEL